MILMIGYYIMSSPSQNLGHQETDYVIEQSDLRSIAECVVGAHNAAMYCQDYTNDCVERYGISITYFTMTETNNIREQRTKEEQCAPHFMNSLDKIVLVTASSPIPTNQYHEMMDVLERYYSDAGTFGLFDVNGLKTASSSNFYEITPSTIISGAGLQNGSLVYYMESTAPVTPVDPEDPDNPENPCPADTKAFFIFGQWYCRPFAAYCSANTVFNPNTGHCCGYGQIVNSDGECEDEEDPCTCSSSAQTPVIVDDECLCLQPDADMDCGDLEPWLNYATLTWECPNVGDISSLSEDCKQQLLMTKISGTLHRPVSPCNACETAQIDTVNCKINCIPDGTKWDSSNCWASQISPEECNGDNRGVYFAFAENPGYTSFEVEKNRSSVSINIEAIVAHSIAYQAHDRKFHCMECDWGLDTKHSISPYIAQCSDVPPPAPPPGSEPVPAEEDEELLKPDSSDVL